jgi:outer membrane protein assembly factor BamB
MSRYIVALVALLFGFLGPAQASENGTVSASKPPPAPVGWPQLLRDNAHSSVSPDIKLSASTASKLGLFWMSALRNADIGSPVVAYSSALGRTVAYVGDERGDVIAYDALTGMTLWSTSIGIGDSVRSSPLVAPDGSVWVGTAGSSTIAKLNGSTGQILCSLAAPHTLNSSFMYASPAGGVPTVYTATNHSGIASGPELAINASNCAVIWSFDDWLTLSGAWATPAFGVDVNGKSRVYVGTADPDSTMYAVDATTGKEVWKYSALNPPDATYDIGAAATISAPGNNSFANGVLYFPSKYGILYALDLTTGKLIWQYNFNKAASVVEGGRSAAALYKTNLVFGMANGVEAVDAVTGKLIWHYVDASKQEVLSSPAIAGPSGDEIVVAADVTGLVTVLRLSDGALLYKYQTGNYVTSSPAIIDGHIFIDSSDGFLYDFANGGYNVASPNTTIKSPATGSDVANPGATLTISGTATSNSGNGVKSIQLAVQRGGPAGPWYDAASGMWSGGATNNFVNVDTPGKPTSTWSFALPVNSAGSTFQVTANAVDEHAQVDRVGAQSSFTVSPSKNAPQLTLSATIVPPASTVVASGGPFKAGETVELALQKVTLATATAGSNGMIPNTTLKVPASTQFGLSAVTATGETTHKATSAAVDISNLWTQLGYDAARTGYEPNDPVLGNLLQSTKNGYLSPAWTFATGAAVDTSPAVAVGAAYVANTAGSISAVDTVAGAALWTYTLPSGAAIHGSPAVGNGDVVVGADDGNLYRLASATGVLLGSVTLDGTPTAPALSGSTLYVGTDNGTVFAIAEASGKVLWSKAVGAAISTPVALDSVAGVLVAGDASGNVTTLNPANGAIIGQVATGQAAVSAGPQIAGSRVLVATSDGRVRAYNETSRKLEWTHAAGSPVHALVSTASDIYVGTDSGKVSKLNAANGSLIFLDSQFVGDVVGIAHSTNFSVVETSHGDVNALKDDQGGRIQYDYQTGAGLGTQPAILDGAVYVGAEDGGLYAFTGFGQAPQGAIEHQFLLQLRKKAQIPAAWAAQPGVARAAAIATRAFAPHGRRDFALHLERSQAPASGPLALAPATRTYVIGWSPVPIRAAAFVDRTRALASGVAGSAVDTDPYPRYLDDAAVQHEVAREIAANRWQPSARTRFVVLTAAAPVSSAGYCSYHSAFYFAGNLAAPVAYGVVPAGTAEQCGPFTPQLGRAWKQLQIDPFARAQ